MVSYISLKPQPLLVAKHRNTEFFYLLCDGRELEDVESFVVHGGALVDIDDHAGFAAATEEALQVMRQLALPEGNVLQQPEREVGGGRRHTGTG